MNQLQLWKKRNEILQYFRPMNRVKNALRWHSKETFEHVLMKLKICYYLQQQGQEYMTEAIFKDGEGRADIVNLDTGEIYEVVKSESEISQIKKTKKYPLPVIFVNANQEFTEELIL